MTWHRTMGTVVSLLCFGAIMSACIAGDDFLLATDPDDEWASRRARMSVTVMTASGAEEWSVPTLEDYVVEECVVNLRPGAPSAHTGCSKLTYDTKSGCRAATCATNLSICTAHRLREIAETLVSLPLTTAPGVSIPPPDAASRAALSERALELAQRAVAYAGENIRSGLSLPADASLAACTPTEMASGGSLPYGESLAYDLAEAAYLARDAASAAVEANVAVADASFADHPNRGEAARAAWTAPVLSRLHAAELLVGRPSGPGAPPGPMPTDPSSAAYIDWSFLSHGHAPSAPPSEAAREMVDVLRQAGLRPRDVLDVEGTDFDDLYTGNGSVATGLREALFELTDTPELGGAGAMDSDEFLELYGFTAADALAARTLLREESTAFGRDSRALVPPYALGTDAGGTARVYSHDRFVSTTVPAIAPPESFYVRLARLHVDGSDARDALSADHVHPGALYAQSSLTGTLDYALSVAQEALSSSPGGLGDGIDALGGLMESESENRLARVETCYSYNAGAQHYLSVSVFVDVPSAAVGAEDFLLVDGTAGVSCATRGNVDGMPCVLSDHLPTDPALRLDDIAISAADPTAGFLTQITFKFKQVSPTQVVDLHLVHRRGPGSSAGSYESYGPVHFSAFDPTPVSSPIPILCSAYGVFYGIDKIIYNTLAPSTSDAGEPVAACGDVSETRIPLENELIDDGDGVESSWRHHMAVARAAAEHADRLGEEVIESGLSIDSRADAANEALLSACGATVDLDGLFGASAGTAVAPGACVDTNGDGEAEGLQVGGSCARLALEEINVAAERDRDARVLADCLAEDALVPAVSLGSAPVCVWHANGDRGVLCDGATQYNRCPYPPTAAEGTGVLSCDSRAPEGATPGTYSNFLVSDFVGFFSGDTGGDGGASSTAVSGASCTDVANLRLVGMPAGLRNQAVQRIVESGFYQPSNVREWARRIGWEPRPRDHSALTIGGVPWLATGDAFAPPGPGHWPCSSTLPGLDPLPTWGDSGFGDSLFAQSFDCGSLADRAVVNGRMARGVLALAILSGEGPVMMRFPIQYSLPGGRQLEVINPSLRYEPAGTAWEFSSAGHVGDGTDLVSGEYYRSTGAYAWMTLNGGPLLAWTGFVSLGDLTPSDSYDQRETIVPMIWSRMSRVRPSSGRVSVWDGWVRNAVDDAFSPDRLLVDGTGWTRGSSCRGCEPNLTYLTEYWTSLATQGGSADPGGGTVNPFRVDALPGSRSGLRVRDVLDGLEIMCEASRAIAAGSVGACTSSPPDVTGRADLPRMREYLLCAANEIEVQGESAVVQNIPSVVLADWTPGAPTSGSARSDGGALGAAVLDARSALTQLSGVHRAIASTIRDVESELQIVELQLASIGGAREILDLSTVSSALDRVTACASSSSANSAVAQCANAAAQIAISMRLRDLERETLARQETQLLIEAIGRLQDHGDSLADIADQTSLLLDQLNGALGRIGAARATARRALANATAASQDVDGRSIPLNTGLANRYDLRAVRYREAHRNAVRLAHVARRSLEQRLGTDLADLVGLSLVDDPAGWVNRLCESSGVDYSRLRDDTSLPYVAEEFMFVGDYVRRLEMVFESYRLDYPFTSGTDTAVISLRDDVRNSRVLCAADSYNLLASSGDLRDTAWQSDGCLPVDDGMGGSTVRSCVTPVSVDPGALAEFVEVPRDGAATAFRVIFGGGSTGDPGDAPVSFGPTTRLYQEFTVPAGGTHLLSWFGRDPVDSSQRVPKSAVAIVRADGLGALEASGYHMIDLAGSGWSRYQMFYELPAGVALRVVVRPQGPFAVPTEESVDLAGLQLEDVEATVPMRAGAITAEDMADPAWAYGARPFVSTNALALASRLVCEDTTGRTFREGWVRGCARVCPEGLERGCEGAEAVARCYYETEFSLSADQLERGEALGRSGFAYGNFNYRTDSFALNFVGSGARTCEDDSLPSTCYSSGFIPYSLEHLGADGGYEVRNHAGAIYRARLFDGRLPTGDGLAAERYITNPLSSADRALVDPYLRREFIGRPVPGRYVLRVWDGPGVNFSGVEDVQIVLNYRYWTRVD